MARTSRRQLIGGATAAFAGLHVAARPAFTQTSPSRPIRILVGFAAGGGNDVIARLVAQKMTEGGSGQVLVDNKTGASGLIAADMLAKAPPDGTTLMVAAQTTYAVAPQLYKSVAFDGPRDVRGVCLLGASPLVLVVNPSFAAKSVRELIDMAKAKAGEINFGSGGVGTTPHMAAELFLFTLAEAGIAGSDVETWFGLTAPAATPRETVQRLNAEVRKALAASDLQRRFAELSLSVTPSSPEELDALIKSEAVRWGEVIRRANIRAPE
jgi:tripartite-type tricarboxylate transporter receptor subunit TctC